MNQPTHAWLAVEAYRKVLAASQTDEGKAAKLDGLARLLGDNLCDVVVAAWLPDKLIKDMTYGHVFKNSAYAGDQAKRFTLSRGGLTKLLPVDAAIPKAAFALVPDEWWAVPYRVKPSGGHLPARVTAMTLTARDMFKMGDSNVEALTGVKANGADIIAKTLLFAPRNIAEVLWMVSHYIADGHMPFHCDNRALASTARQSTHCDMEKLWGQQVADIFHADNILLETHDEILAAIPPANSQLAGLDFGGPIAPLRSGDTWKDTVFACRAAMATSFGLVPPGVAGVDDPATQVPLDAILADGFCGKERFWDISRAIMTDAVNMISTVWVDAWAGFVHPERPVVDP